VLCRTLEGHAHWVNSLALNVDYVLRTGPFNPTTNKRLDSLQHVIERYEMLGEEKLVSASDDFTLFLWRPEKEKKPIGKSHVHDFKIQLDQLIDITQQMYSEINF